MASTTTITAHCLCRKNTFSCDVPSADLPLEASFCHCDSCRHGTGTLSLSACPWPSPLPKNLENCTRFPFSPRADIYFCSTCGTWLFWHSESMPWLSVSTGALEDPAKVCKFSENIFLQDTKDGGSSVFLENVNGVKLGRFIEHSPGEEVASGWPDGTTADSGAVELSKELNAHCKYGGVKFKVTRPNEESANPAIALPGMVEKMGVWWLNEDKTKFSAGICVCDSCRLGSGMEYMPWSFIPTANIQLEDGSALPNPPVFGTIKTYNSSERADRYFCGTCGATLFWISKRMQNLIDVATGLYDAESGARAEDWLHWRTEMVANSKDGLARGVLTEDLVKNLKAWGERRAASSA